MRDKLEARELLRESAETWRQVADMLEVTGHKRTARKLRGMVRARMRPAPLLRKGRKP